MNEYYILNAAHEPVKVKSLHEWARFFEIDANRRVAETVVDNRMWVSTVFIGLDMNYARWLGQPGASQKPILFETMTFFHNGWQPGGEGVESFADQDCDRYATWADAEKGHRRMCNVIERRLQEYDARVTE